MAEKTLLETSRDFSVEALRIYRALCVIQKERVLSERMLKSATNVGAFLTEARYPDSHEDYVFRIRQARKEAAKAQYWLEVLHGADVLPESEFTGIYQECCAMVDTLSTLLRTVKNDHVLRRAAKSQS